ncbi:MAG: o-succinylbenzoate---CoA ligase [Thermoleophilales bacterium]|nr:o-succinylbenzoate---CoA ligase [Thermoleophilales bacterium]
MAEGRALSYAELSELADRTARRLAARGVGEGDRVAVALPAGIDFAAVVHALPRLGAVLVPVNTRLGAAERAFVTEGARVVVEEPLDGEEADVALRRTVDPEAPHSVIHTSGTTSRPKPVVLTYANHLASAEASAANLGVRDDDAWLGVLPLFHVGGLQVLLRSAIYGTTAVLHDGFDVDRVRTALESGEVTLASFVPTMVRRLREAGWERAPRLRAALLGGGPVPRDLLEWAVEKRLPLLQTYGMTETASQIVTAGGPDAPALPLPGVELRTGSDGELLVRGPMVSVGALSDDGWLHTGDRGTIAADGSLHVEGRIGDTIVTGGENVAAAEVEAALLSHPAVRDAGVVGRADPEWGQVVTAYVVADGVSDDDLLAHARERLAGYKLPKAIHRRDELPRNAAGKLVRRLLDT